MGYFPFFMEIEGKRGLIVGGGKVAERKVQKLLPFGPKLTVVAPVISPELLSKEALICLQRDFQMEDIQGQMFVIAASDDPLVNRKVGSLCRERDILVNVADEKEACSFLFPALVKEGKLTVGISTEGASPAAAGRIRSAIETSLSPGIGKELEELAKLREQVIKELPKGEQRTEILRKAAYEGVDRVCGEDGFWQDGQRQDAPQGRVILAGAGCGVYDLITVRGLNAVKNAQVLIYDDLIDEKLLSHAGESCERIYVGKRSGKHSVSQEEINALLVAKAKEGKLVVRLKGGDPFVFGRGGEEILALRGAGIAVEEIPGVSSAVAVPAAAGIPVTYRKLSQSFHVITGHGAKDSPFENMEAIASLKGTLVFLMGIGNLKEITEELIACGKPKGTPAAVVREEFDGRVSTVRGSLFDIAEKVENSDFASPGVIVIGECAGLDLFGVVSEQGR